MFLSILLESAYKKCLKNQTHLLSLPPHVLDYGSFGCAWMQQEAQVKGSFNNNNMHNIIICV